MAAGETHLNEELQKAHTHLDALSEELSASEAVTQELRASYEGQIGDANSQIATL